jgi:hypothetical protein
MYIKTCIRNLRIVQELTVQSLIDDVENLLWQKGKMPQLLYRLQMLFLWQNLWHFV